MTFATILTAAGTVEAMAVGCAPGRIQDVEMRRLMLRTVGGGGSSLSLFTSSSKNAS